MVEHVGGDGTGEIRISSDITLDIAQDFTRTHIQSSLYIYGTVNLPTTVYVEQYVTNEGHIIGAGHWYSRGHTKLLTSGQSSCSSAISHAGKHHFLTLTVLNDGDLSIVDSSNVYDVNKCIALFTDTLRMEGQSDTYIEKSANVMGRVLEFAKQSEINGDAKGYGNNAGPGAGCTNACGSGGGHGGSGGSCNSECGPHSCSGGAAYDSSILPSLSGSGGALCSHRSGAPGGSGVRLVHTSSIIEGTVTVNGGSTGGGGGGGAGGSVWLDGDFVSGWGSIHANGGNAGRDTCYSWSSWHREHKGGGGGGGRIRTWGKQYTSKVVLHQRYVSGGTGVSSNGHGGSTYRYHGEACSGHGKWTGSACQCYDGYVGYDCQFSCHRDTTCGGHGDCNDLGQCNCTAGYVGTRCESQCHRDVDCNGHGDCSPCGTCVCDPCFSGPNCATKCSGFGSCVADQCVCDSCHLGVLCESECNNHGSCNSTAKCECDANWGGDKCTIKGCPGNDLNCSGNGICNSGTGECFCEIGWRGEK